MRFAVDRFRRVNGNGAVHLQHPHEAVRHFLATNNNNNNDRLTAFDQGQPG